MSRTIKPLVFTMEETVPFNVWQTILAGHEAREAQRKARLAQHEAWRAKRAAEVHKPK